MPLCGIFAAPRSPRGFVGAAFRQHDAVMAPAVVGADVRQEAMKAFGFLFGLNFRRSELWSFALRAAAPAA
ncbi:hypothetical protein [Sorangium sp. So ce204]|uniref:hypothetical protein n=1 Tax=Sorangium sp. So ce204 TaxID=3133288 RepID=UPI003F5ED50B